MGRQKKNSSVAEKIQCQGECKRELTIANFYKSNSPLFKNNGGRVNICKKCIQDMINYDDSNTIFQVLQALDVPFSYDYWEIAKEKNPNNVFGKYITMVNSLSQFSGLSWKDSVFENKINNNDNSNTELLTEKQNKKKEVPNELKEKWGDSYNYSQIQKLEDFHKDMINSYDVKTASHKDYLNKICKVSLKMDEALDSDNVTEFSKLSTVYDNLMKSAKFTAVQRSAVDDAGGFATISEFTDALEKRGFIMPTKIEEDYDIVEQTIADLKNYTKQLVLGDSSISTMAQKTLLKQNGEDEEEDNE